MKKRLAVLALLAVMAGCGDRAAEEAPAAALPSGEPTEVTYAPDLDVSLERMNRTGSGLYVEDVTVGTGEAATAGRTAVVHYTGWLPNGTEFDSSRGRAPFSFELGQGNVIEGWEQGVDGMRVGGRRRLVIPSSLGYGAAGAGDVIPPNATLVFDVELLELR